MRIRKDHVTSDRRRGGLLAGLVAAALVAQLVVAGPAAASATGCDTGTHGGTTCVYVNGSGARINYARTYHYHPSNTAPIEFLMVCNYRAWNKWRISTNGYQSRTSSIVYSCDITGQVTMTYNMNVVHPSYFEAQFYAQEQSFTGWLGHFPRVLITA